MYFVETVVKHQLVRRSRLIAGDYTIIYCTLRDTGEKFSNY